MALELVKTADENFNPLNQPPRGNLDEAAEETCEVIKNFIALARLALGSGRPELLDFIFQMIELELSVLDGEVLHE
jgi:hypothetical protein